MTVAHGANLSGIYEEGTLLHIAFLVVCVEQTAVLCPLCNIRFSLFPGILCSSLPSKGGA